MWLKLQNIKKNTAIFISFIRHMTNNLLWNLRLFPRYFQAYFFVSDIKKLWTVNVSICELLETPNTQCVLCTALQFKICDERVHLHSFFNTMSACLCLFLKIWRTCTLIVRNNFRWHGLYEFYFKMTRFKRRVARSTDKISLKKCEAFSVLGFIR